MRKLIFASLFSLSLAACQPGASSTQTTAPAAPTAQASAGDTYGEAFTVAQTVPVSALSDVSPYAGKTVQLEGKISAVCQKAGCWMELVDDSQKIRVRVIAKDHGFAVPKDSSGKHAVAQGILEAKELDPKEAAHLAEDAGLPAPEGPVHEIRLEATGVVITQS